MIWPDLISLSKWLPLSAIPFDASRITDRLFAVAEDAFILVTTYADVSLQPQEGGPFVSAILWACDTSAAGRAVDRRIEDDEGIIRHPPEALLPALGSGSYKAILAALRRCQ